MMQQDTKDNGALSDQNRSLSPLHEVHKIWLIDQIPSIQDSFIIKYRLGKGTFGEVYLASLKKKPACLYALKHILPISTPHRIENEIKCKRL